MSAKPLTLAFVALMLGGCSTIPETISTPVDGPTVNEARADPRANAGRRVRWGGTVSEVSNLAQRTVITVVSRPLTGSGEPLADRAAQGRFLAEVGRFLDPEEYKSGLRITVVGRFTGIRQDRIGEYLYDYPVVQVQHLYTWREPVPRSRYRDWPYYRPWPYWHDPYWPYHRGYPHYPWYY